VSPSPANGEWTVRAATLADAPVLADFNCRMALETENKRLDPDLVRTAAATLIARPEKGRYLVACDPGTGAVIGQLMLTYEWSDWRNGDLWWIQSVYVAADYRRRGVYRTLYERVETLAKEDGTVVGIRLYVEVANERAQATYAALGMKDAHYRVYEKFFIDLS
jgi:ribosomal protein S18 acetylase RimI-like enzyme